MTKQEPTSGRSSSRFFSGRNLLLILTAVLILVVGAFWAASRITTLAEQELLKLANNELEPNAELRFGDFELNFFPARIAVKDVQLHHIIPFEEHSPQKPLDAIRSFGLDHAELSGISLYRLIRGEEWALGELNISGVRLDLVPTSTDPVTDSSPFEHPLPVTVSDVRLTDSHFNMYPERTSETPNFDAMGIHLHINNVIVEDAEAPLHRYFEAFRLDVDSLAYRTGNGFYELTAGAIAIDSGQQFARAEHAHINPRLSPYEVGERLGHEEDVFDVKSGPIHAEGFQVKQWLASDDVTLSFLEVNDLSLEIEREKTHTDPPRDERPLPPAKFADLPFDVNADSIHWNGGLISYTETYSDNDRKGTILFADVDIRAQNFQNRNESEPIVIRAQSRFMEESLLEADFEFFVYPAATHHIRASLEGMDLQQINNPLENLAAASIRSGELHSLGFSFTADDDGASGELTLVYDDLEVRFLDDESMEEGTRTRIQSFIANTFAVRSSNEEDDPRVAEIDFEREKDRSMFNYWWKTIQSGLMDTVKR
jgi:hypothetical protein